MEKTLEQWVVQPEPNQEEEDSERTSPWELLKEEIIGPIRVVMRKDEKMKNIEVRAYRMDGKQLDRGRGWAQYLPTWRNTKIDSPAQAEEYYRALIAWFKGGRQGRILPFKYRGGS